jgi:hypothetical protein
LDFGIKKFSGKNLYNTNVFLKEGHILENPCFISYVIITKNTYGGGEVGYKVSGGPPIIILKRGYS